MTEQEKQVIDGPVSMACNNIAEIWDIDTTDESQVKLILKSCIQAAFWAGLQHKE